jgi:hypothetical protein
MHEPELVRQVTACRDFFRKAPAEPFGVYALDFGYLTLETFSDVDQLAKTAATCLGGLIRYLSESNIRGRKFKSRDSIHLAPKSQKPPR